MEQSRTIYETLCKMFPDSKCELIYNNTFELLIATILSAQTKDSRVNKVTPILFAKYKNPSELKDASIDEVSEIIKPIGLATAKANNIIKLANDLVTKFNSVVPNNYNDLILLSGVGRKTANVVLAEGFNIPRIAVDTHVYRVAIRLGLANKQDTSEKVEQRLMDIYNKDIWCDLHLKLLFFGRYFCTSKNPSCLSCPFKSFCSK